MQVYRRTLLLDCVGTTPLLEGQRCPEWHLSLGWAAKGSWAMCSTHSARSHMLQGVAVLAVLLPAALQTGGLQPLEPTPCQPCPDGSPHVPRPLPRALPRDKSGPGGRCATCSSNMADSGQRPLSHTRSQLEADFKPKSLLYKRRRDVSVRT